MPKQKTEKPAEPEIPKMIVEVTEGGSHTIYPSDDANKVEDNASET